jgi:hypothetical protein
LKLYLADYGVSWEIMFYGYLCHCGARFFDWNFAFMTFFWYFIESLITYSSLVLAIESSVDDAIVVIEAVHAKMEEEHRH